MVMPPWDTFDYVAIMPETYNDTSLQWKLGLAIRSPAEAINWAIAGWWAMRHGCRFPMEGLLLIRAHIGLL